MGPANNRGPHRPGRGSPRRSRRAIEREGPEGVEGYVSILPISLEVHVERLYKPTHWHGATYLGPQLSLSVFALKASAGLMFNANDQRDRHVQLGIGCGF
jgi:hypothetical protein